MPSRLLTLTEMHSLVLVMRDIFAYILRLKTNDPVASYVQYPKIPPLLSESLAIHLISSGRFLDGILEPQLGGRVADIIAHDRNGRDVHIEVKGTGTSEWVYMGRKDYAADYLIWMSFDDFFENSQRTNISVYCIKPADIGDQRQRITLRTLGQVLGGNLHGVDIDLISFLIERN